MNTRKSILEKRNKRSTILIALMFLALISPKAWGYAQKELPSSFSEKHLSSDDTFSSGNTFSFSRAILTDEKGQAICQSNLEENPELLPRFAELGSSHTLEPIDLPECEEQNLDILAQYAEQAWIKKEVAIAPVLAIPLSIASGCAVGFLLSSESFPHDPDMYQNVEKIFSALIGGISGSVWSSVPLRSLGLHFGIGAMSGLVCSTATHKGIFYLR